MEFHWEFHVRSVQGQRVLCVGFLPSHILLFSGSRFVLQLPVRMYGDVMSMCSCVC